MHFDTLLKGPLQGPECFLYRTTDGLDSPQTYLDTLLHLARCPAKPLLFVCLGPTLQIVRLRWPGDYAYAHACLARIVIIYIIVH